MRNSVSYLSISMNVYEQKEQFLCEISHTKSGAAIFFYLFLYRSARHVVSSLGVST